MSEIVLKIEGLSKNYKNVQALKGLSITVEAGMVFGILGPNGSGKTTTLGILLGVLNASSGSYSWFDNGSKDANRKRIGALLETPNFYPYLSAVKNLRIVAQIKKLDNVDQRIDNVLSSVNLLERKDSAFKTFSLGMKQRLAIASALLNDPEVLVLDEPTNGLDPQGIAEIRQLILNIAKEGKTILIASHQLDEIEKVCTDVAILKKGDLIRQSKIGEIIGDARQITVSATDINQLKTALSGLAGIEIVQEDEHRLTLAVEDQVTALSVNEYCFKQGIVLSELKEAKKSLEEQFLAIVK
jgi:ABC-type multidrug transport system ATPase subunit